MYVAGQEAGQETDATYIEEPPSGHVEAGKKAATSAKGSQWLREVEVAFDDIRAKAQQEGLDAKLITRQEATKLASVRRKSLNEDSAVETILNRLRGAEIKKAKRKTRRGNRSSRRSSRRNMVNSKIHYADESL